MTRRSPLLAGMIAFLIASVATYTESTLAIAGTYQVSACNYAPEGENNSWSWSTSDPSNPAHYSKYVNCPDRFGGTGGTSDQEGGLSTTDTLGLSNGAPPATLADWSFDAPEGTTITGLTYDRYIGHLFDSNNVWSPALRADGTIVPGETCLDTIANSETCFIGGPPNQGGELGIIKGISAHRLSVGIECQAPTGQDCVTGATLHSVWAAMYGATVTLSDTTPPSLSTPSGTLWSTGDAGGFHKGTESVTISAQDVGGGVRSIVLSADGQSVESYASSCDFTFARPCGASTGPQTLTLPSSGLGDGAHTLTLAAIDAAGNESTVASEQISVDNNPPPAPIGLSATATQPNGTTFTASWSDPAGQVAPIVAATYQVCPVSGVGACSEPVQAPAGGPATVVVPGTGAWALTVWLADAAGNSSTANAARTTFTVPAGGSGGGSGPPPGGGGFPPPPQVKVRVSESLRGRELVVSVSGPAAGRVRVGFTGRLRGRTVASGARTVGLKHGLLRTTFKLGPRTAAHAAIHVSARLDHELVVTSTLQRHTSSHKRSRR